MSWDEVKYAINSTLGTSLFKPLDKILGDKLDQLLSKQYGERLITSNEMFIVPENITTVYISGCGAGGQGIEDGATSNESHGGNAGEFIIQEPVDVLPGQVFNITVGMGNTIIESTSFTKTLIANAVAQNYQCHVLSYKTGYPGFPGDHAKSGGFGGAFGFGGGGGGRGGYKGSDGPTSGGNGGSEIEGGNSTTNSSIRFGAKGEDGGSSYWRGGAGGNAGGYGAGGGGGGWENGKGGNGTQGMVFFQWGILPR